MELYSDAYCNILNFNILIVVVVVGKSFESD
jgi:hypothetical protein